jgi:hypothetical protein
MGNLDIDSIRTEVVPEMFRRAYRLALPINQADFAVSETFEDIVGPAFGNLDGSSEVPTGLVEEQRRVFEGVDILLGKTSLGVTLEDFFKTNSDMPEMNCVDSESGLQLSSSGKVGEVRAVSFKFLTIPELSWDMTLSDGINENVKAFHGVDIEQDRVNNPDYLGLTAYVGYIADRARLDLPTSKVVRYYAQSLKGKMRLMPFVRAGVPIEREDGSRTISPVIPQTGGWKMSMNFLSSTIAAIEKSDALSRLEKLTIVS